MKMADGAENKIKARIPPFHERLARVPMAIIN